MREMGKRRLAHYQRRTIALVSELLRHIPDGHMDLGDSGPWLKRAFWLSRLHHHVAMRIGHLMAMRYVNHLLMERRGVAFDQELYWTMVEAGHKPTFARWLNRWEHPSYFSFQEHFAQFREYLEPQTTFDDSLFF